MKKSLFILLFLFASLVYAGEWKPLIGYSLHDLYSGKFSGLAKKSNIKRKAEIKGTSGLSWPDGRQAIITLIEIEQEGNKWLYKCIDFYSKDMQQTGQVCYELRK